MVPTSRRHNLVGRECRARSVRWPQHAPGQSEAGRFDCEMESRAGATMGRKSLTTPLPPPIRLTDRGQRLGCTASSQRAQAGAPEVWRPTDQRRVTAMRHSPQASNAPGSPRPAGSEALSRLSVRELISELARVEESLRTLPALISRKHALLPNPARRPLLRRERAIMVELATRRRERGLSARESDRLSSAAWPPPPRA